MWMMLLTGLLSSGTEAMVVFRINPANLPQNAIVMDLLADIGPFPGYHNVWSATSIDYPIGNPPTWVATFNLEDTLSQSWPGWSLELQILCGDEYQSDFRYYTFGYGLGPPPLDCPVVDFPGFNGGQVCPPQARPRSTPASPLVEIEYLPEQELILLSWERVSQSVEGHEMYVSSYEIEHSPDPDSSFAYMATAHELGYVVPLPDDTEFHRFRIKASSVFYDE